MDSEGEHVRACRAGYAAIPRWCQKAPDGQPEASHSRSIRLTYSDCGRADERTRTADLSSLRVRSHTFVGVPHCSKSRLLKPSLSIACFPMFAVVRLGYCHGYCQSNQVTTRGIRARAALPTSPPSPQGFCHT